MRPGTLVRRETRRSRPRRLGGTIPAVRAGFTLVELLVGLTVGGIVAGSMLTFFLTQLKSSRLASVRIEAVQRSRFAFELMRREIGLAGAGIPDAQPLVAFAGPDDVVFSVDLASSTPGDRVAVYQLPGAPLAETEGADSGSLVLPNGAAYPDAWYGPGRTPGPAETVRFSFVERAEGDHALVRAVNGLPGDTLLRGLGRIDGRGFFSYRVMAAGGELRDAGEPLVWHEAAIHGSPADTGVSALADSIKLVEVAFTVQVRGRRLGESVKRDFVMALALQNAGLIRNAACGDAPHLGVVPGATLYSVAPASIEVTWSPAIDETEGEMDVRQYTLYRATGAETVPRPIASLPPDPNAANYTYVDADVEPGATYVYYLGATDCTPAMSPLAQSPAVTVPAS